MGSGFQVVGPEACVPGSSPGSWVLVIEYATYV